MEEVERCVEQLIACAHEEQDSARGVVDAENGVGVGLLGFVTSASSHHSRVQMEPVTGNIYGHGKLEEEHVIWVEVAQRHQQAHGATAVSQLIQHCSELGALVEQPGCMSIKGIKKFRTGSSVPSSSCHLQAQSACIS